MPQRAEKRQSLLKKLRDFIQIRILPLPSYIFIRFLWLTVRANFLNEDIVNQIISENQNYILCFWHGNLLLMIYAFKGHKRTFLVSFHRDGELITRIIKNFGVEATRGSSSKGGTKALLTLLRKAKNGYSIAFTPDGPKGPARKAQSGIVELARLSGLPIVPVGFYARSFKKMNSWDSFVIPLPFTKVAFYYGEPIYVKEKGVNYLEIIEKSLNDAENKAKEFVEKD